MDRKRAAKADARAPRATRGCGAVADVVLCGLPVMTAELIRRITEGTGLRVVADVPLRGVSRALRRTAARLLLVGLPDARVPNELVRVMADHPAVTVLGVVANGARTFRHELTIRTVAAGELSADLLAGLSGGR